MTCCCSWLNSASFACSPRILVSPIHSDSYQPHFLPHQKGLHNHPWRKNKNAKLYLKKNKKETIYIQLPSIAVGSLSADSTNYRLKLFGRKKNYLVADVNCVVKPMLITSILTVWKLFSCHYPLNIWYNNYLYIIYIELGIIYNLDMI